MPDPEYFIQRETQAQLSRDLFQLDFGFHSEDSDKVRKLVQMGWRKVAPVDADESESTGDVKPTVDREMLKANFPDRCTAVAGLGKYACPWDPHRRICGMETMDGADRCPWHGGPGTYTERIP